MESTDYKREELLAVCKTYLGVNIDEESAILGAGNAGYVIDLDIWKEALDRWGLGFKLNQEEVEDHEIIKFLNRRCGVICERGVKVLVTDAVDDDGSHVIVWSLSNGVYVETRMGETLVYPNRAAYADRAMTSSEADAQGMTGE